MKFIRALVSIAPEVLVAAAPYAEEKGIKILIEVHGGWAEGGCDRVHELLSSLNRTHAVFYAEPNLIVQGELVGTIIEFSLRLRAAYW